MSLLAPYIEQDEEKTNLSIPISFASFAKRMVAKKLISFVSDRLGHDKRYAINYKSLNSDLNWEPLYNFDNALPNTIDWYVAQFKKMNSC